MNVLHRQKIEQAREKAGLPSLTKVSSSLCTQNEDLSSTELTVSMSDSASSPSCSACKIGGDSSSPCFSKIAPTVPKGMQVDNQLEMNLSKLYSVPLVPLDCKFNTVKESTTSVPLKKMLKEARHVGGKDVTVVFAIRRVACGACRENALQLSKLAELEPINLVGIVKDGEANKDSLLEFYQDYFRYPLYRDMNWGTFSALGNRKLSLRKIFGNLRKLNRRFNDKNINNDTSSKEDGWTQGGFLIFDKKGKLRGAQYEQYGKELDIESFRQAIQAARIISSKP